MLPYSLLETVYPRVCGGTSLDFPAGPKKRGLSPRVRGNLRPVASETSNVGSIPACAGEPSHPPGYLGG